MENSRPLSGLELELFRALEPLLHGEDSWPDLAEIEKGAFLWLVREAWKEGPRRDGRSGHLKDEEVAAEIAKAEGVGPYDRNKFQLQFGRGKRLASGQFYHQPIPRSVASAFLRVALNHWDLAERDLDDRARIWDMTTAFAGLKPAQIDKAIEAALAVMFPSEESTVLCRRSAGVGPKALYRDLGRGGFSLIVIGRGEALRMDDPDAQIFDLAKMLNLLLCQGRGEAADAIHIWAFPEPEPGPPREMIPRVRSIRFLREMLGIILDVNDEVLERYRDDWPPVALDRCFIAMRRAEGQSRDTIFDSRTPEGWLRLGVPADPGAYIPVFARNPESETRFFSFAARRDPAATPFIEVGDPAAGMKDELVELHEAAIEFRKTGKQVHDVSGWRLFTARSFIGKEPSSDGRKEKA